MCDKYAHRVLNSLDIVDPSHIVDASSWFKEFFLHVDEWSKLEPLALLLRKIEMGTTLCDLADSVPEHMRKMLHPKEPWASAQRYLDDNASLEELVLELLSPSEYIATIETLQHTVGGPKTFVNILDKLVDAGESEPDTYIYFQCLQSLQDLCSRFHILPCCVDLDGVVDKEGESYTSGGSLAADIYKGKHGNREVSVKVMRSYDDVENRQMQEIFYREAVTWKHLKHDNIVPFSGVTTVQLYNTVDSQGAPSQCMISDWMGLGNIREYLQHSPDANRLKLIIDCIEGLQYLHKMGLVHGDLKGVNILINYNSSACLYDFTQTSLWSYRPKTKPLLPTNSAASVWWMAPELLNDSGSIACSSTDIFSLAMLMLEVFTGKRPFAGQYVAVLEYVVSVYQSHVVPERYPGGCDIGINDRIWTLMTRCWERQPSCRPRLPEILSLVQDEDNSGQSVTPETQSRCASRSSSRISSMPSHDSEKSDTSMSTVDIDQLYQSLLRIDQHRRIRSLQFHQLQTQCACAERLPSEYTILDGLQRESDSPVAKGGFAWQYHGRYRGREVAIKVLARATSGHESEAVRKSFVREGLIWKQLDHPNIVGFIGVSDTAKLGIRTLHGRPCLCLVSDWMPSGNLVEYLKKNPGADRVGLLVQAGMGLNYLHSLGIAHGDLKGVNILIDSEGHAKLGDFGLTRDAYDPNMDVLSHVLSDITMAGTWRWMAPEMLWPHHFRLQRSACTTKSDIYAFGMVMYEVFSGQIPFQESQDTTVILKVYRQERPSRPGGESTEALTDFMWNVIEMCWQQEPEKRPSIHAVLDALEKAGKEYVVSPSRQATIKGRRRRQNRAPLDNGT
ncbi:kinase-like protein [Heliocybe sulcata]|uniref:Kinase-like protein n=1 Tax=Heliocybe sulcata TaxID=5364 RepID=A0A5C3N880_9AGAM|nr:kinase-like protein [Heliocybe sulcata]